MPKRPASPIPHRERLNIHLDRALTTAAQPRSRPAKVSFGRYAKLSARPGPRKPARLYRRGWRNSKRHFSKLSDQPTDSDQTVSDAPDDSQSNGQAKGLRPCLANSVS